VDAHMHSFQIATRGLTSDKGLLDWLKKYIWRWEGEMIAGDARACAELAYLELLRSGVTAFADYTSVRHTSEAFSAARRFGLRGNIGKTLMDRASPPELQEDTDKALRDTESLIRKWHMKEGGRLRYNITPRFGITCTDGLLRGCGRLAGKYGTLFTTHANESMFEVQKDRKNYGKSSVAHLHELGLLGPKALLVHCVWLDAKDWGILRRTGTKVAHCPGSNMMLASGCAEVGRMLKAGITVGLGSDMGAYYSLSLFDQMRLSVLMRKAASLDPVAFDHNRAFSLATKGGAECLGLESGALARGMKADVTVLSGGFHPPNDIVSQIVYCGSPADVESVVCDGKVLMRDGKVLVVNEEKVLARADGLKAGR
jgi:5-methylthioadenosine/S-adenosylhomocysteine deaminase